MRTLFYYAGCVFVIGFVVIGLLASCHDAHGQPPQLLPHTSAAGTCDLWEARYQQDPSGWGWVHFQDGTVRGYLTCDDCAVVGRYDIAHFADTAWTVEFYCLKPPQHLTDPVVIWAHGVSR